MRQTFSRRSVLGYAAGTAAGAVLLSSTKPSQAAPMKFKADMTGASEVPPVQGQARGTAAVNVDDATKQASWRVDYTGLSGPATAAHIHCGRPQDVTHSSPK